VQRHPRTRYLALVPLALAASAAAAACSTLDTDPGRDASPRGPGASPAPLAGRAARWQKTFGAALSPARPITAKGRGAEARSPGLRASLPEHAAGVTTLAERTSGLEVGFALDGAAAAPLQIEGDVAVYASAGPEGADVLVLANGSGVEDFVAFERRPAREELAYAVDVRRAAGLRLVAGSLEVLDAHGAPRLRVAPPEVIDARGARHAAALRVDGCAFDADPRGPWGRPVVAPGAPTCTVRVSWDGKDIAYPALVDPAWAPATTLMAAARTGAASALLDPSSSASRVLIAGGFTTGGAGLASAELYEPLSRTFAATGSMSVPRGNLRATRLSATNKASILISGGLPSQSSTNPHATLELYDPDTGFFGPVKNGGSDVVFPSVPINQGRSLHTATLLSDGVVLLAGGAIDLNQPSSSAFLFTFSPNASTLAPVGSMSSPRAGHTATLLPDGQVLMAGGHLQSQTAIKLAELYDPASVGFKPVAPLGLPAGTNPNQMKELRTFHTATLVPLADPAEAVVVIAGGVSSLLPGAQFSSTVELYEHRASVRGFSALISAVSKRASHTTTALPTGDLLLLGGTNENGQLDSTELFRVLPAAKATDPTSGQFVVADPLPLLLEKRSNHVAELVNAGDDIGAGRTVMIAGGVGPAGVLQSGEVLIRSLGEKCTLAAECLSGFCVDGVCCNTACGAECYSCVAAEQAPMDPGTPGDPGPLDGTCRPEKESVPPAGQDIQAGQLYPGELPSECNTLSELHFKCDGKGKKVEAKTFPCLPSACGADKKFCETSCNCNTADECKALADSAHKCFDGGWCKIGAGMTDGQCQNKGAPGAPCAKDYECGTAAPNCVDGVCCTSTCTDQCAACNLPGFQGQCQPRGLQGDAAPQLGGAANRKPCDGDGTPCSGICNTSKTNACVYPGAEQKSSETTCACEGGDCTNGPAVLTHYVCDGKGGVAQQPSNCGASANNAKGGLKCEVPEGGAMATACLAQCAQDADCFKDFYCDRPTGQCQPLPADGRCDEAYRSLRKPGADPASCGLYICQPNASDAGGACLQKCGKKSDCADDKMSCNTDGVCVTDPKAPPEAPSCALAAPSGDREGEASALGLLLAAAAIAGARSRRPRRPAG
jgi:hypothetical protein